MKTTVLLLTCVCLFTTACSSNKQPTETVVTTPAPVTRYEAASAAMSNCAAAVKDIAISREGDAASKVAAVGAIERLCAQGGAQVLAIQQQQQVQPQSIGSVLWGSFLQASDLLLRVYGIKTNRDISITQSNNSRDVAVSTNSSFLGMGQQIQLAGTAGYQYVQAPAPNITLSGQGIINTGSGSASYVGPVNRNCTGGAGQAAQGGSGTATIPGVPGGAAPGGAANC